MAKRKIPTLTDLIGKEETVKGALMKLKGKNVQIVNLDQITFGSLKEVREEFLIIKAQFKCLGSGGYGKRTEFLHPYNSPAVYKLY